MSSGRRNKRKEFWRAVKSCVDTRFDWEGHLEFFKERLIGDRLEMEEEEDNWDLSPVVEQAADAEKGTLIGILHRAIHDYVFYYNHPTTKTTKEQLGYGETAFWWFDEEEEDLPMYTDTDGTIKVEYVPYRWLCQVLKLGDPDVLFNKIMQLTRKDISRSTTPR